MIDRLSKNKTLSLLLLSAYFLFLIYFHERATVVADWLKDKLTLEYYNPILLWGGLFVSLAPAYQLWRVSRKFPERRIFLFLFLITLSLMAATVPAMMVVNIEAVHFVQYAILGILFFTLVKRYEDAFIGATVLGILDEIYQYLVLNPDFKYFDFNDIILNMLGAGAGLIWLAGAVFPAAHKPGRWYRAAAFYFILSILLLGLIFSFGKVASFFPSEDSEAPGYLFSLYRENLGPDYWTYLYGNRYYHILRPWEGIGLMAILTACSKLIDHAMQRINKKVN